MRDEVRTRPLRTVLIVTGGGLCLCGALLLLPESWLRAMAGLFVGAGTLDSIWPEAALFTYMLRASLAAYLWIGIVLLVTASDPPKYRALVDVAICMLLLLAVVCTIAGITGGVPALFYLGDAVPSFVVAALLLAFRARKRDAQEGGAK